MDKDDLCYCTRCLQDPEARFFHGVKIPPPAEEIWRGFIDSSMETRVDPRVDGVKIKVLSSHGSKMNDYLAHSLKAISREYGGIKIFLETMTLSDIRDDPQWWNMQNIYQYFSTSSCYFILCHPSASIRGGITMASSPVLLWTSMFTKQDWIP